MNNCCKNILKDILWLMEIRISLYESFGHNTQAAILKSMLNDIRAEFINYICYGNGGVGGNGHGAGKCIISTDNDSFGGEGGTGV